jgi:hypothetical protein
VLAKGYDFQFQRRYRKAARRMVGGALVAGVGAILFAYAAHPPRRDPAARPVLPTPTPVYVALTEAGRRELSRLLGDACVAGQFRALAIDGSEPDWVILTIPELDDRCLPAQFKLGRERGSAVP